VEGKRWRYDACFEKKMVKRLPILAFEGERGRFLQSKAAPKRTRKESSLFLPARISLPLEKNGGLNPRYFIKKKKRGGFFSRGKAAVHEQKEMACRKRRWSRTRSRQGKAKKGVHPSQPYSLLEPWSEGKSSSIRFGGEEQFRIFERKKNPKQRRK